MVSAASSRGAAAMIATAAAAATAPQPHRGEVGCERFRAPGTITPRVTTNPNLRGETLTWGYPPYKVWGRLLTAVLLSRRRGTGEHAKFPQTERKRGQKERQHEVERAKRQQRGQ